METSKGYDIVPQPVFTDFAPGPVFKSKGAARSWISHCPICQSSRKFHTKMHLLQSWKPVWLCDGIPPYSLTRRKGKPSRELCCNGSSIAKYTIDKDIFSEWSMLDLSVDHSPRRHFSRKWYSWVWWLLPFTKADPTHIAKMKLWNTTVRKLTLYGHCHSPCSKFAISKCSFSDEVEMSSSKAQMTRATNFQNTESRNL